MQSNVLTLHAKIYALGDKYEMNTLKTRALDKFEDAAKRLEWQDEAVCKAITTVYSNTIARGDKLRLAVVAMLDERIKAQLELSMMLDQHICGIPELAVGLWVQSRVDERQCPICRQLIHRQCPCRYTHCSSHRNAKCSTAFAACTCVPFNMVCGRCMPYLNQDYD